MPQPAEITQFIFGQPLKEEVSALKTALQQGQTTKKKSLSETAKALYEQYGWAGDLLKKLLGVVIPGWLS